MGIKLVNCEPWCPACATPLSSTEIEPSNAAFSAFYVKFDLTPGAFAQLPELAQAVKREGAIRAAIILTTATPALLAADVEISLHPSSEYVALKAPTLEGTEIWIIAGPLRENFERVVGFDRSSAPLLTLKAARLKDQTVRHPLRDGICTVRLDPCVSLKSGTGALPAFSATGALALSDETSELISRIEDSGLLVAREDASHSEPSCGRCHQPVVFRMSQEAVR